jgi:heparan-alpha-glucosaminide N-acetyltransferase
MTKISTTEDTPLVAATSQAGAVSRIASIDILRALTMVLMIFVNDLWSLKNIPEWLEHVAPGVDGMGLADIVFPAFLFIVGLSLPFAVSNRRKKGDTNLQLVQHIIWRTIALLTMGVFLVNGETINAQAMNIPSWMWNPVCCICFILIWNTYPAGTKSYLVYGAKALGILTLLVLAIVYRGEENGNLVRFAPQWWGILGLIGWAYLASALVVVFSKNNLYALVASWIFFSLLSMFSQNPATASYLSFIPNAISGGTLTALTLGGVISCYVFRYYRERKENRKMAITFIIAIVVLIALSLLTRPYWGISKLGATPAWLFICSAITLGAFLIMYWITDVKEKSKWFTLIKPAGTDTLLCYLIPYVLYAVIRLSGFTFPSFMLDGGIGLLKSLGIALLCVIITRTLNRAGIRLKL